MFSTFDLGLPSFILIEFQGLISCPSSCACCQATGSNTHPLVPLQVLSYQKHIPFFDAFNLVVVPCAAVEEKAVR